jgi:segregation and condensation protein B
MQDKEIKNIVEAALLAAGRPLSLDNLAAIFGIEAPEHSQLARVLEQLGAEYADRGIMLAEVASGYRIQTRTQVTEWVSRLWEERPQRYTRALLETLALIAYRQPITRGEIENIRGVSVSTNIIRTLSERGWVKVVGHRDVPGRPAMYGTTRDFLDYFGLKRLDELPTLAELRDLDSLNAELDLREPGGLPVAAARGEAEAEYDIDIDTDTDMDTDIDTDITVTAAEGETDDVADAESADTEPRKSNVIPLIKPGSV